MLRELHIKNIAVIDEATVEFGEGFNALTGETGAGKSILIDSIGMVLGARVSRDLIRTGCEFASASLCFDNLSNSAVRALSELEIECEDGLAIISRKITADGKSICRINGRITTLSLVREAAAVLIDIHGQNDNRSLLSAAAHMRLLDEFGKTQNELESYRSVYKKMCALRSELEKLTTDEETKARRLELLEFQINEIAAARLKEGEEEEIIARRDRLCNAESIAKGVGEAYGAMYGGEEYSAYDLLRRAARSLSGLERFAPELSEYAKRLDGIIAETDDIASELSRCLESTDFSAAELDMLEERLDLIGDLKRKYGASIEEINDYKKRAEIEAEGITRSDERAAELSGEIEGLTREASALAKHLTDAREKAAEELSKRIMEELAALDMPKARFEAKIGTTEDFTANGTDTVEFLLSANSGEEPKPLARCASGGELSRIMLAMKSTLSDTEDADTMIFDEIDTGVSGRAAQRIAEKICVLSRKKQILAITHLSQLASMADGHYLIEKHTEDGHTSTSVRRLDREERCAELARIIGGVSVTELTLSSAREMLEMAEKMKERKD